MLADGDLISIRSRLEPVHILWFITWLAITLFLYIGKLRIGLTSPVLGFGCEAVRWQTCLKNCLAVLACFFKREPYCHLQCDVITWVTCICLRDPTSVIKCRMSNHQWQYEQRREGRKGAANIPEHWAYRSQCKVPPTLHSDLRRMVRILPVLI